MWAGLPAMASASRERSLEPSLKIKPIKEREDEMSGVAEVVLVGGSGVNTG